MTVSSVKKNINKFLSKIKNKKGVYTAVINTPDYTAINTAILKNLVKKLKTPGIYITLNKTYDFVTEQMKKAKIESKNILFIDGTGMGKGNKENCITLSSNDSLTELSIALSEASKDKKFGFVYFDSVSTLLIYNNPETTEKFMHFLINKIRNMDMLMIILTINDEKSKKLIPVMAQFCDECIEI